MRRASVVALCLACAAPALAYDEMGRPMVWSPEDQRAFHLACRQATSDVAKCECILGVFQEHFPSLAAFGKNREKGREKAMLAEAGRRCGGDERSGK